MNKKLFIGGCGLAAIAGNVFAADEEYSYFTPYVALKGGYSLLGKRDDIKYKGGFAGAVEMGVAYDAWRAALELGFKSNKIKEYNSEGAFAGYRLGGKIGTADCLTLQDADEFSIFRYSGGNAGSLTQNTWYVKDVLRFSKVKALTGMVNVYYDYAMTEAWSIYAGLGLGVAKVSVDVNSMVGRAHINDATAAAPQLPDVIKTKAITALNSHNKWSKIEVSKTVFAWQLMAGVAYELSENLKLTFGYKLFNTAKVKLFGKKIKTPFNHTAEFGAVLSF